MNTLDKLKKDAALLLRVKMYGEHRNPYKVELYDENNICRAVIDGQEIIINQSDIEVHYPTIVLEAFKQGIKLKKIELEILKWSAIIPYYRLNNSFDQRIKIFHGHNPLTGVSNSFIFNEPIPGKAKIISWNYLSECWFYSEDAGLTWLKLNQGEVENYMYKADVMYPSKMRENGN